MNLTSNGAEFGPTHPATIFQITVSVGLPLLTELRLLKFGVPVAQEHVCAAADLAYRVMPELIAEEL
jgi:hypothetical protein